MPPKPKPKTKNQKPKNQRPEPGPTPKQSPPRIKSHQNPSKRKTVPPNWSERAVSSIDRPTEVRVRSFERADHQLTRFRMRWSRPLRLKRHSHVTSASASGGAVSEYTAREAHKNRPWEQTNRPSTTGPYSHTSTWEQGASHMGACCIWEERKGERKERKSLSACGFFHTEKRQERSGGSIDSECNR